MDLSDLAAAMLRAGAVQGCIYATEGNGYFTVWAGLHGGEHFCGKGSTWQQIAGVREALKELVARNFIALTGDQYDLTTEASAWINTHKPPEGNP